MYEHYKLDQQPKRTFTDPSYEKEEGVTSEKFMDPDFDQAWDTTDQESKENTSQGPILAPDGTNLTELAKQLEDLGDIEEPMPDDITDWEEVE